MVAYFYTQHELFKLILVDKREKKLFEANVNSNDTEGIIRQIRRKAVKAIVYAAV